MKYSFKDILIGLRSTYLSIRDDLVELEKYIQILDEEISKCKILLNDENNKISIYFFEKERFIIAAIINIEKKMGLPVLDLENLVHEPSIKSIYYLKNSLKHYHITIQDINKFNKQALNILENEFINMMQYSNISTTKDGKNYNLELNYNHLKQETDINFRISSIGYYPIDDFIKINFLGQLNQEEFQQECNVMYDKDKFNSYQQKFIEQNNKDIYLSDAIISNPFFNIIEEDKKLILVKR